MKNRVLVTKSFLPPLEEYVSYLKGVWDSRWVTNHGKLAQEFESRIKALTGVKHAMFVTNGTIALQLAIRALELNGEIITTPFTFAATTTSILWEKCKPVFVDIDPTTFAIDAKKIERAITKNTKAILAVHVYGYPCDVVAIEKIAKKHNLKVIYDAAHAFGVKVNGQSLFKSGDISTLSLHATKLFHSGEGGMVLTDNDELAKKIKLMRDFGLEGEGPVEVGINGKNSELHAAMGLSNLKYIDSIREKRRKIVKEYKKLLKGTNLHEVKYSKKVEYNHSYFPVVFKNEFDLLEAKKALEAENIFARRYFYPSLNTLPFVDYIECPISESVSQRVLCLPLYHDLSIKTVNKIIAIIKNSLRTKPTLTIGIPAYNEAESIGNLIKSIQFQEDHLFRIEEIIVNSDGSSDETVQIVNNFSRSDRRIKVINNTSRRGKAYRLNEIYKLNQSDYLLMLDSDVLMPKKNTISKFMEVFNADHHALVVAGNFFPIKPKGFLGKIMYSNNILWNNTRENLNRGDHIANLYGGASMLKKDFSKEVIYPANITCDEEYLYVMAKKRNGFRLAKDARVLFTIPNNLKEIVLQAKRFHGERNELVDIFGPEVLAFHFIPVRQKTKALLKTLIAGEYFVLIAILLNILVKILPTQDGLNKQGMWQVATSTKMSMEGSR